MEFSRKKAPACIGPLKLSTFVCEIAQINEGVEKISVFSREIYKVIAMGGGLFFENALVDTECCFGKKYSQKSIPDEASIR